MKDVSFGEWMKERRRLLRLTQTELADKVSCSRETVQKLEGGTRRPSRQMAELIARVLGAAPEEIGPLLGPPPGDTTGSLVPHYERPDTLPRPLTRLVGREDSVAEALEYLLHEDVRLLTIVGPPGVGKTRLALEIAWQLSNEYAEDITFVELAPISDSDLVPSAIAEALQLKETGGQTAEEILVQVLRNKRMLLVLDNFEQVIAGGIMLVRLLEKCSLLKVLVTSREALRVQGEQQFLLPPLTLPELDLRPSSSAPSLEELAHNPAVALFVDRARAVQPAFRLTTENAGAVATLCIGVDGLPLAIELVSARTKMLPPERLVKRLGNRLSLLTSGARNLPARQQTLIGAIEWSYNLLGVAEQALFRRLGVFAGGCTFSAIESVCNALGDLAPGSGAYVADRDGVFETVASLLDKSLLRQEASRSSEPRFYMLETIREFSTHKLEESGEAKDIQELRAGFYLALAEATDPRMAGRQQKEWLDRLEAEHGNIRAAMHWCRTTEGEETLQLRLAVALGFFWEVRGYYTEGLSWLTEALELMRDKHPIREEALLQARAYLHLGRLAASADDYPRSEAAFEKVVDLGRDLNDTLTLAYGYSHLGWVYTLTGRNELAGPLVERGLALFEKTGDTWGRTETYVFKAMCAEDGGLPEDANHAYDESLRLAAASGDVWHVALSNMLKARLMLVQKEYSVAMKLFEEALSAGYELDDRWLVEGALRGKAHIFLAQGDVENAIPILKDALALAWGLPYPKGIAGGYFRLAWAALLQRRYELAGQLVGAGQAVLDELRIRQPAVSTQFLDAIVPEARASIGDSSWRNALSAGREMPRELAIEHALSSFPT